MATKQTSDNSLLYDMMKKEEALEKKERLNKKVEALNKELNEIAERAYQAAISAKVEEYQQQARRSGKRLKVTASKRNGKTLRLILPSMAWSVLRAQSWINLTNGEPCKSLSY